jgi:alkylated DNA repair dioxygenase AlkB
MNQAIQEFKLFANEYEQIFSKETYTNEWWFGENIILIILPGGSPRKDKNVNIHYYDCPAGSPKLRRWLDKYGFGLDCMNGGLFVIYKKINREGVTPPSTEINNCLIEYSILPNELCINPSTFDLLWTMIPSEYNFIKMFGKLIQAPRKYKVYGQPYKFTGMNSIDINEVPEILQPYLDYINTLDRYSYNSVLINWYEGKDYIGFHSDNTSNLVTGSNIYGISFGQHRTLRFKNSEGKNTDYLLEHNSIINMKHGCQDIYKHSILQSKKLFDRRINITFRSVKI